jgi:UPF0755 protein
MTEDSAPRTPRSLRVLAGVGIAFLLVAGAATTLGRMVADRVASDTRAEGPSVSVDPGQEVELVIPIGATGQDIAAILAANGVVGSATEFELALRRSGAGADLKAGAYLLVTGMDPAEIIAVLVRGPIADTYRVTIPEGLRLSEIIEVLARASGREADEFEQALLDGSVSTSARSFPEEVTLEDWEGLLFPDTYEFLRQAPPADILSRLARTMEQRLAAIDWSAFEERGFDRYQGIIMASLIESEVRVADERTLVSSVIHNRLAQGMRLEIDATVLYAMGTRDVTSFDREIDSPYNTYRVDGLPPTPIASPGRAALEAAAAPAQSDYLFYVLTDFDGGHAFTTNFEDHQQAVADARERGVLP